VLRLLDSRDRKRFEEADLAMLGISLANVKRWPEADKVTAQLGNAGYRYIGDYLYELVKTAEYQGLEQVVPVQLKALEHFDPGHPGLAAGKARLLRAAGQNASAEQLLRAYLRSKANSGLDLTPVRYELYSLLFSQSETAACNQLVREALQDHGGNLRGFVALADFIDYRGAYTDIPLEERDRIKAPSKPLDFFDEAPPGFTLP
jgi:hypothetical protein